MAIRRILVAIRRTAARNAEMHFGILGNRKTSFSIFEHSRQTYRPAWSGAGFCAVSATMVCVVSTHHDETSSLSTAGAITGCRRHGVLSCWSIVGNKQCSAKRFHPICTAGITPRSVGPGYGPGDGPSGDLHSLRSGNVDLVPSQILRWPNQVRFKYSSKDPTCFSPRENQFPHKERPSARPQSVRRPAAVA